MLIKWCKIQYLCLGKAFLFQETRSFIQKIENFDELLLSFFAEILHTFPPYQCLQKGVWDLFYLV